MNANAILSEDDFTLPEEVIRSRTYDTSVMLMAIADTVCPPFLQKEIQDLIAKCFERLPDKFEIVVYEDEK